MSKTAFGDMPEPKSKYNLNASMFIRLNVGKHSPIGRTRLVTKTGNIVSDLPISPSEDYYLELEVPASNTPESVIHALQEYLGDFAPNAMDAICRYNVLNTLQHAIR